MTVAIMREIICYEYGGNNVKQRNEDESQEMIYKVNSGGNKRLVSLTEECWWSTEIKSEQFMNIVG